MAIQIKYLDHDSLHKNAPHARSTNCIRVKRLLKSIFNFAHGCRRGLERNCFSCVTAASCIEKHLITISVDVNFYEVNN